MSSERGRIAPLARVGNPLRSGPLNSATCSAQPLSAGALAFAAVATNPVFAQMNMDHAKMDMAAAPGMTEGEVRKIDRDAGKITIKHGDIKHMDMPPMTMVFVVKDKALLDKAAVGARILFMAANENGQMTVTDIQPAK